MAIATGTALALAATLAAAGTTAYNTNQTNKRQDRQAAAGITQQAENQRKNNARIGETIDKLGSSEAADNAKATTSRQYLDQVQANLGKANASLARKNLNADFDARAGGATAANEQYGTNAAGLLARMDAPTLQRMTEGNVVNDAGMDLAAMDSKIQGDAFVNNLKLAGIRRNPYLDLASQAMSGYASGVASRPSGTMAAAPAASYAGGSVAANGASNLYRGGWGA